MSKIPYKPPIIYPNTVKAALQRRYSMPQYHAWISAFLSNHDMTRRTFDKKLSGASSFTPAQAAEIAKDCQVAMDSIFQYEISPLITMEP